MTQARDPPAELSGVPASGCAPAPAAAWVRALPNALTALRIGLAVGLPLVAAPWRLPFVVCAGVSDALDGWIARRYDAATVVGAVLDGVADKLFVIAVLLTLLLEGSLAWWEVTLLVTRDITVGGTFLFVLWQREWGAFAHMAARLPGKLTTAVLFAWFVAVLAVPDWVGTRVLFWAAAALSFAAAVDYAARFTRLVRGAGRASERT